jgi:ubiquinone/menaquinone biosynthesis C-methylase UbiE
LPQSGYDTVICLNVLEHLQDDKTALLNVKRVLARQGRVIELLPQDPWNFGTLDRILGHRRRYSTDSLGQLARNCGFEIERPISFNRIGTCSGIYSFARRYSTRQLAAPRFLARPFR